MLNFERAVWAAFAQLLITYDEAVTAIERYRTEAHNEHSLPARAEGEASE